MAAPEGHIFRAQVAQSRSELLTVPRGATKGRKEASTQPDGWEGGPLRAWANTQTGPEATTALGLALRPHHDCRLYLLLPTPC